MSDYVETLWSQFVIETEEHLELIEPLLVEAEFNPLEKDGVDQLFRSFHSIKGLSKAMDLVGMETVAHRAEDILGLVRDDIISVDSSLADALLNAIDALKQHLELAASERRDQPASTTLVTELEAIFNAAGGAAGASQGGDDSDAGSSGLEGGGEPVSLPVQAPSSLHEDPDMVVFFVELLQSSLPSLVQLLADDFTPESENAEELLGELETLLHASSTMELGQLAEGFKAILSLLTKSEMTSVQHREEMIKALMALIELIRIIEGEVKQDCGIVPLVDLLRTCTAGMIERLFQELTDQLRVIGSNSENHVLGDSPEVIELMLKTTEQACVLNNYLRVLDRGEASKHLLLTVSEVCSHIHQGHAAPESGLIQMLLNAVSVAEREYGSVSGSKEETQSVVDWDGLHHKIWDAIKEQRTDSNHQEQLSFKELTDKIEVNPLFEDCMSEENVRILIDGLEEGGASL